MLVLGIVAPTMPILKISSAVEHYRYFSRPEFTIHSRAGHSENGLPNIKFVSARIVAALEPGKKDILVDVGCGDGYLLARGAERGGDVHRNCSHRRSARETLKCPSRY